MITNKLSNMFANNAISTQSVEFDLTPTVLKEDSSKNPSSLLSLSNYLQFDDSSLFYHEKYPQSNQKRKKDEQKVIKKSRLFIQIQDHSYYKKYHLKQSFCPQNQDSQSMLLLDSEVKYDQRDIQQSNRLVDSKQMLTQAIFQANVDQNETKQSLFSRIQQKQSSKDKNYCTDSIELMNLLSIPNDSEISKLRQSIRQIQKSDNQIQSMKKIMEFFSQNICRQNKLMISCTKCKDFEKRIKILEQYIGIKEKQISKYESLIDQLNSKVFDLKIQNKRLSFQNQKYLHQVQELLSQRTNIKSKQRLNTISYESSQDCSFFDEENFGVINSAAVSRVLSRKNTMKQGIKPMNEYQTQIQNQDSYLSPSKACPQTPMPTMTYIKQKKQRKPSNFSDHSLQISISKVKEPSLYRIAQMKIQKIMKQNNLKSIDKKKQNNLQRQNSTKRFSDLLNQRKFKKLQENEDQKISSKDQEKNKKNKSPLKKHDFYKIKTKQLPSSNNLKNHPLNQIFQQQDNLSESSETKTQKFYYGSKKSLQSVVLFQQNDYNILNRKEISKGLQNNEIKRNKKSNPDNFYKNQVVYKSFKQIGTFNNENSQNKQIFHEQKKIKNQSPYKFQDEYGIHLKMKNVQNKNTMTDKIQRKCFSPLPNSLSLRKQNTQRSKVGNSPLSKENLRQTQIKSFFR